MIFLSSVAATFVFFDNSGDIIHINISTSVGLGAHAAFVGSTPTEVETFHFSYSTRFIQASLCKISRTFQGLLKYFPTIFKN